MFAYRLLLMGAFALGFGAPVLADDDMSTVVGALYEHGRGVIGSGVNLGATGGDGMFEVGLIFEGFRWAGDPTSVQSRPEGAAFAYLTVSAPYPVSPYVELGYNPIGLLVLMTTDNKDNATGSDLTAQEPWDSFFALGVKAQFGHWGSLRLYHRWYEVFHYDSQTSTEIQTNFHTWGSTLSIFF
jgi:hypothetical protein